MSQRITMTDLLSEVRNQLNEENKKTVSDTVDIIPALNRAQNFAIDILAREYKEPLMTNTIITTVAGQDTYPIPEEALEERLLKVETQRFKTYQEVRYINHQDVGLYEVKDRKTSVPLYYTIVGSNFKIIPSSNGIYPLRVWYLKDPPPLGAVEGRINIVNASSNYVRVDEVGSDLSAESDNLASFVNIVDGSSGIIKGTLQIQSIVGTKITFKTVPTRTTVLDLPIDTSLSVLASGKTIEPDDYLCLAPTSCVPFLKKPLANFIVQYAVAELTRKLGGDYKSEADVLNDFREQVKNTWLQRPNNIRVRKRNSIWGSRRYLTPSSEN